MTMQANLTNRDAARVAASARQVELRAPARPGRTRRACPRRSTTPRCLPPAPPSCRCQWTTGTPRWTPGTPRRAAGPNGHRAGGCRPGGGGAAGAPDRVDVASPCLVAGPDIDASGAWDTAVALAEKCRGLPVFASPATGGGQLGFPEGHPNFQGVLAPAIGPICLHARSPTTWWLCAGTSVFPYYPHMPGPAGGRGHVAGGGDQRSRRGRPRTRPATQSWPTSASRWRALLAEVAPRAIVQRPTRSPTRPAGGGVRPAARGAGSRHAAATFCPEDAIVVLESPSSDAVASATSCASRRPGSYYFGAGGGLGFGLSAAIGVAARPARPTRSSACSARARPSTRSAASGRAVAYEVPVTFLVLRNEEYAILKWFADVEEVQGAPGLDLPAVEYRRRSPTATASPRKRVVGPRRSCARRLKSGLESESGQRADRGPGCAPGAWPCSGKPRRNRVLGWWGSSE